MLLTDKVYIAGFPIPRVVVGVIDLQTAITFPMTYYSDKTIISFVGTKEIKSDIMLCNLKSVRHL